MSTKTSSARRTRSGLGPWLVLPALILLAVFIYRPLVRGAQLSLTGSDLFGNPSRFVGLANYVEFFSDPAFQRTLWVSLTIAILSMVMSVGVALAAVLLIRRWLPGRGLFQIVFSLPFAYSAASASAVFFGLFAPSVGSINLLLAKVGIEGPPWLQSAPWAIFSISATTAWYESGFAFLVLTAAIKNIPEEIIEAADLDGLSGFGMARWMLVPLMAPSLFFLFVTQTIGGLQTFTQVYVLTRGGPSDSTTTLVFDLYQLAFGQGVPDFGRASVIAVFLIVIVATVTAVQFKLANRKADQ
jgi:sn-glycerol 3-phosphate transport system permease protein